jgi:uncharacterized protein
LLAAWSKQVASRKWRSVTNSVTHFEIYAEGPEKLADFYRGLLGWQIEKAPGLDYWHIKAAPKAIGGGLTFRPVHAPGSWVHYIHVDSLDEALNRALTLGGKVVLPKTAVPKTAWYAVIADPEENVFALWQADQAAFPPPEPD